MRTPVRRDLCRGPPSTGRAVDLGSPRAARAHGLVRLQRSHGLPTLPPSTMSVPRPAMLVAMVTAPGLSRPGPSIVGLARACCLALSTWCGNPTFVQQSSMILGVLDRRGAQLPIEAGRARGDSRDAR